MKFRWKALALAWWSVASCFAQSSSSEVFPLGVASGDPSAEGFVLMTHLSRKAFDPQLSEAYLEIAPQQNFTTVLVSFPLEISTLLLEATAESMEIPLKFRVEDTAAVQAGTTYYYRFRYQNYLSPIGRARSLPEAKAKLDRLRLGVVTCQDYTTGNYHSLQYLADEKVDFIVHLGDVVYEYSRYPGMKDRDIIRTMEFPNGVIGQKPEQGLLKATTLADYRAIYRRVRLDPAMQRVMQNHTWIYTRDDHETADDSFWDYSDDAPGFPEHDVRRSWAPGERRAVKLNALRAWSEFIPMGRVLNSHSNIKDVAESMYKTYHLGGLMDLLSISTRDFRSDPREKHGVRTMLGTQQKKWLAHEISQSQASWQIIANQIMFSPLKIGFGQHLAMSLNKDAWDGYADERNEIIDALATRPQVAIFTGDMHSSLVSYLKSDYTRPSGKERENIIGAEFMTPSLTSPHMGDNLRARFGFSGFTPVVRMVLEAFNPHIKHLHGSIYGYAIAEITPEHLDWYVYKIGKKDEIFKHLRKHLTYTPATRKIVSNEETPEEEAHGHPRTDQ